jgi:hypothetical protein
MTALDARLRGHNGKNHPTAYLILYRYDPLLGPDIPLFQYSNIPQGGLPADFKYSNGSRSPAVYELNGVSNHSHLQINHDVLKADLWSNALLLLEKYGWLISAWPFVLSLIFYSCLFVGKC